ncbi:MAG TPA: hypothetical protein VL401_02540 [Alphaproteobacteria bacterium]|jgi:hypothetical protein|nr:hypothetical protein [Alphaproteobacteria bacterium]
MNKLLKYFWLYKNKIILFTVIGSILLTTISAPFHCIEWHFGEYDELRTLCGWPKLMYFFGESGPDLTGTILYNFASLVILAITSVPNLLFWGIVSLVLILIFYTLRFVKQK